MRDPFALLSMFVGGPVELETYGGTAVVQTDDRLALEFSGPRAVNGTSAATNTATLRRLLEGQLGTPSTIVRARSTAGARQWRDRGTMVLGAGAYDVAYQDFLTASRLDPADRDALAGIVRTAVPLHREADAATVLKSLGAANPTTVAPRIALSKLEGATGAFSAAAAAAKEAGLTRTAIHGASLPALGRLQLPELRILTPPADRAAFLTLDASRNREICGLDSGPRRGSISDTCRIDRSWQAKSLTNFACT
jgi:hypothetical protein